VADEPVKSTKKRRVRDPETFRERAIKVAETPDKPSRRQGLKQAGGRLASPARKPFKAAAKIGNRKGLRWLKKPFSLIGKILLPVYFRNSWRELRKVQWPSRRQSLSLTFAVLVFATIFGAAIAVVDYGLDKVFRNVLLK